MANKNLDAKHEKILKALLRLPENKRCAVCDTLVRFLGLLCGPCLRQALSIIVLLDLKHAFSLCRGLSTLWSTSVRLSVRFAAECSKFPHFMPSAVTLLSCH